MLEASSNATATVVSDSRALPVSRAVTVTVAAAPFSAVSALLRTRASVGGSSSSRIVKVAESVSFRCPSTDDVASAFRVKVSFSSSVESFVGVTAKVAVPTVCPAGMPICGSVCGNA